MTFPWLNGSWAINNKINQMINQRVDFIIAWGFGQELVISFGAGELWSDLQQFCCCGSHKSSARLEGTLVKVKPWVVVSCI
jgi:hypothetical protein